MWTHLDLVGRCCTRGSCRPVWSQVATGNKQKISCTICLTQGNVMGIWIWILVVLCMIQCIVVFYRLQKEQDSQFYQSTSGTRHRTDMNGGCWSCSFYTLEQTCCSLKNEQRSSDWVSQKPKALHVENIIYVDVCVCFLDMVSDTYRLSYEHRHHRT